VDVVGENAEGLGFNIVDGVCARAVRIGTPVHELRLVVVGAAVVDLRTLPGDDAPFFRDARLVAQQEGMPLRALKEGFLARKDDLHRPPGQARKIGRARSREADAFFFSTEGAAQRLLDDLHAVHRGAEDIRDVSTREKRVLRGGEHGHVALVGVVVGKHRLRLDICMLCILGFIFALDDHVRARKRRLHIAFFDAIDGLRKFIVGILFMHGVRAGLNGRADIIDRIQRLIFDFNRFQRVPHKLARFRGDECDHVAFIADDVG